ncbi:MAG: N-ethylmaleimide reductase [Alphaproteobacteria bacterium]|nr:N-ethylmaleimide reductase [Alphaproteobacteria bacterium]
MSKLFEPTTMGSTEVSNRVFMAPLTRNRAKPDGVPSDLASKYYAQRASGGLLISEATQISAMGKGYLNTPGIYTDAHVEGWKKITKAVHEKGGKIFLQLWHVGRISHSSLLPEGQQPLAPSAIRAKSQTFTEDGMTDVSEPRAMTIEDIKETIKDYRHAAECAKRAGFDGVEVHSANGYLLDQFIQDKTNKREDEYGGTHLNRARFLFEVLEAVTGVWGADKVGVRLSPTGTFNDMGESNPTTTFGYVIEELNKHNLAYLHMVERFPGIETDKPEQNVVRSLRHKYKGFYIANGNYDNKTARSEIETGYADAIAFGRAFIANPDLPKRLEQNAEMNEADQTTFYGGGAKGYTDYPFLKDVKAA